MSDYLLKSIIDDGQFRAYAVDATDLVREAQQRHDTWSAASAALGRSLIGTLLLSSSVLKGEEKMTVRIDGGGPVGGSSLTVMQMVPLRAIFKIPTSVCL